jgi:beta-lactamase class A
MKLLWHFFSGPGRAVCHNASSMKRSHCFAVMLAMCCAPAADLTKDLEHIAQRIGGRAGVSAVLIESGEHVALHGDLPFFMASVVKFPVALRVLQLVDEGKLRLDQKVAVQKSDLAPGVSVLGGNFKPGTEFTIRDLLNYMITASDNTACDVLMRLSSGPQAVMARVQDRKSVV